MENQHILFAVLACASFAISTPVPLPVLESTPLENECVGKGQGADCTTLMGVLNVPGKCQESLVSGLLKS